jgi:small subunit ribosomal protein S15
MAIYLTKEKQAEIFKEYGGAETNTGSTEGQIALFTYRIQKLSEHLKENRKDHSCRRSLLALVGKRKQLLSYLSKKDLQKYRELIEKLGLRK